MALYIIAIVGDRVREGLTLTINLNVFVTSILFTRVHGQDRTFDFVEKEKY